MKVVAMLAVAVFAAAGTGCARKCLLCKSQDEQPPAGAVETFDPGTPVGGVVPQNDVTQTGFEMPTMGGPINMPVRQGPASVSPAAMVGEGMPAPDFGGIK